MIRIATILALTVLLSSCTSSPTDCARSSDCFAYETCSLGECVTAIETVDAGATDAADGSAQAPDNGTTTDASTPDAKMPDALTDGGDTGGDLGLDCPDQCSETEVCESGECTPAPALTEWRLDGELVARTLDAEALFYEAQDTAYIAMPHFGRNVTVSVTDVTTTPTLQASCDDMSSGQRPWRHHQRQRMVPSGRTADALERRHPQRVTLRRRHGRRRPAAAVGNQSHGPHPLQRRRHGCGRGSGRRHPSW